MGDKENKLTPMQEKFAQEIAKGLKQYEAYQSAYPKAKEWKIDAVYVQACKELANPKISLRIDELKDKIVEGIIYTRQQSFDKINKLQKKALKKGKIQGVNTALKAEKMKGELVGMYIKQHEVKVSEFNMFRKNIIEKEDSIDEA